MNVVKVLQWVDRVFKDKALRKTIVYRTLGIATGFLISYGIFRTVEVCLELTITIELAHSIIYYIMEKFY